MKEAKRRMRRRRALIATALLLLAGTVVGAALALDGSPHGSALGPTPAQLRMSPLSSLAARMAFCGNTAGGCTSPDGKWSVVYVNRSAGPVTYSYSNGKVSGYNPPRVGCTLNAINLAAGSREQIHLNASDCDHGIWLGHRYLFQDPVLGSPGRLMSIDLPSRRVQVLAQFEDDVVSPDGRWIAGEAQLPHRKLWSMVVVLSLANHTCQVVARTNSPSRNVSVDTSPWEFVPFPSKGFKDPVAWRDVVQGGTKTQVASGPGTGFTQDGRSIIVAEWQNPPRGHWGLMAVHKRLVQVDLASLHTPCPASVVPGT